MAKPCPGCGAATVPEARFCRLCGVPLNLGSPYDGDLPISPLAQTIPLTGESRTTDGLASDEARRAAVDTSKVGREEMENLLRREPVGQRAENDGEKNGPQTTTLVSPEPAPQLDSPPASGITRALPQEQASSNASARRMWQVAAVALLCVALVAGVLAFVLSRRATSMDADGSSPISISDQKQLVSEKLAEAEVLVASGEFNRAITVLRAAVKLDPTNADVRIRLGNALEKAGERNEAIGEYRAAIQNNPSNVAAWRALAAAQFEEKLYNDAAESYRRLIETTGESNVDDETRLAYADALRLAGRTDEARAAYQKISRSAPEAVTQAAREHLVELGPAVDTEREREDRPEQQGGPRTTSPETSSSTSSAGTSKAESDPDSYYFKALNIVNGREPRNLSDGELAAALNYFLRAQGGTHSAEAKRNAERLGREYDRRKNR